jgi:hypothetical protein
MKDRFQGKSLPDTIDDPEGETSLSLYSADNPDRNLFNSIDEELIRISGSEILLFKYYPSDEYDEVYMESKKKVIALEPIKLFGSYDPRAVEENLGQFGVEVQNDQVFMFNKSYVERRVGRSIIAGDILKPLFQNMKFEVFEVQDDSFEIYGIYHLMVHAKLLRDTEDTHSDSSFDTTTNLGGKL